MSAIQFISITPEQLQQEITKGIKSHLDDFLKNFQPKEPNDYLSRTDVAKMLGVDISTISNWQKNGKLKPYAIGGRILFKRADIEASLIPLNG